MDVGEEAAVLAVFGVVADQRLAAGMLVKLIKVVIDTILGLVALVVGLAVWRARKVDKWKQVQKRKESV